MSYIPSKKEDRLYQVAFELLMRRLSSYGNVISSDTLNALSELVFHLSKGIRGILDAAYYLASLDPGLGKTEAIACVIQAWKVLDFKPEGSILIGVNSKDQIKSLIKRLGVEGSDYACLTRDESLNSLGMTAGKANDAHVLITTHQMIVSRTRSSTFTKATNFFYKDFVRSCRVWDESFMQSAQIRLNVTAIQALADYVASFNRPFADDLSAFAVRLTADAVGTAFTISPAIVALGKSLRSDAAEAHLRGRPLLPPNAIKTLETLKDAGGRSLMLGSYGGSSSLALTGATKPLPEDFAPAIILDASGRVRGTYDLLEKSGAKLVRLPEVINDYAKMHIHLWRISCGKQVLRDPKANWPIFRAVAEALATAPDEEWLILGEKEEEGPHGFSAFNIIKESVPPKMHPNIHYLHWGKHMATNEFKGIRNVIVIGSHLYGSAGYDALAAAAIGGNTAALDDGDRNSLIVTEYQHNILQGMMRSNGRNAKDGVSGEVNAYVLASPVITKKVFEETFPNSKVTTWKETESIISKEAWSLINYVATSLEVGGRTTLRKRDAIRGSGINKGSLSKMLGKEAIANVLRGKGITWNNNNFVLQEPHRDT